MLALLGGTGVAALYVSRDVISKGEKINPAGAECKTIQTVVLKTPSQRLWLRRLIRMEEPADGKTRIRTALRVAGLLAKANPVDLVQVSVLDVNGPAKRADMRGRAIGAEVVIALKPEYLPGMKEPFIVRYYDGMPSPEGRYYGERISLEVDEIKELMGAMRDIRNKRDCDPPEKPEGLEAAKQEHQPSGPVVKEGDTAEAEGAPTADAGDKTDSFLGGMLEMIGFGSKGEKDSAPESHEAKADVSNAVADDEESLSDGPSALDFPVDDDRFITH